MRISDWSSDVCSSDLGFIVNRILLPMLNEACFVLGEGIANVADIDAAVQLGLNHPMGPLTLADFIGLDVCLEVCKVLHQGTGDPKYRPAPLLIKYVEARSEEHTSELQSLMRSSYAVFCLKKKNTKIHTTHHQNRATGTKL